MTHNPSHIVDAGAAGVILGTLVGWLPPIAAILGIAWYAVLFYDRFVKCYFEKQKGPGPTAG